MVAEPGIPRLNAWYCLGGHPVDSANPLLETQHLVKRYGDKLAVDDVNLRVHPGEIFGFLGPNGAGKTTTIRMVVGLLKPSGGSVHVAGYDVQTQPLQAKATTGVVPAERHP